MPQRVVTTGILWLCNTFPPPSPPPVDPSRRNVVTPNTSSIAPSAIPGVGPAKAKTTLVWTLHPMYLVSSSLLLIPLISLPIHPQIHSYPLSSGIRADILPIACGQCPYAFGAEEADCTAIEGADDVECRNSKCVGMSFVEHCSSLFLSFHTPPLLRCS